ncbi:MAG: hypothetical protein KDK36_22400 [Leptospiraceae bacterium]|nr:hypothetical protein [Leptospiraceae bacterium]
MTRILMLITAILLISNCSTPPTFQDINTKSKEMYELAMDLDKNGKKEEALRIMDILQGLYADDPKVKSYIDSAPEEQKEAIFNEGMLGFNKGIRAKVEPTTGELIMWYIPDRILDAIEMVDFWLNIGPQIGFGAKATSALQAEAFAGAYIGAGIGQKKMLGIKTEGRSAILIGPFGPLAHAGSSVGTGGFQFGGDFEYFHTPSKPLYQDLKDYWALGFRVGVGFWGVEFEYHPIEIVDFIGGIFLFDPLNDDFATTRGLDYTSRQRAVVKDYISIVRSFEDEDIAQYKTKFPKLEGGEAPKEEAPPAKETKKKK